MKTRSQAVSLWPRIVLFILLGIATLYLTHFALPGNLELIFPDISFSPVAEILLFLLLTAGGLLVAFWITFGDLINRGEK